MRAVIIGTGYVEEMKLLMQHLPNSLLSICDKPIIVHIIEKLKSFGINQVDIVLYHMPIKVEHYLLTGKRWGVQITYHVAKDPNRLLHSLKPASEIWKDEPVLFGRTDLLPLLSEENIKGAGSKKPVLYYFPDGRWTGWALFSSRYLSLIPDDGHVDEYLKDKSDEFDRVDAEPLLSTCSFEEFHRSNLLAINHKTSLIFPSSASEIEPNIWISRGVSIYPGASIIPPVFIGEETKISEGATAGPNAVIESYCLIGKDSVIEDSVIRRKSYVGDNLNINHCLVDCNILVNLKLKTEIIVKDDFILGKLFDNHLYGYFFYFLEKVIAGILLIIVSPLYLWIRLFYTIDSTSMLKLPAPLNPSDRETFEWYSIKEYLQGNRSAFLRFSKNIPNLINVLKGNVHFVGSSPRTPDAAEKLPDDWKKLYLNSKVGLITLYDLEAHEDFSSEHIYTSEVFYAVHMSGFYDFKLLLKWMKKKILNFFHFLKS